MSQTTPPELDLKTVENLRGFVSGMVVRTPCLPSEWLSQALGGQVWLKCENLQYTGSLKVRGPLARLPYLTKEQRFAGLICASVGNHGKAVSWAAQQYGLRATIVVPKSIPELKEKAIRRYGAQVVKAPYAGFDDTQAYARKLAEKTEQVWISSFDDAFAQAGNGGTTGLEIFEDLSKLDAVVVPCGGGGTAIGIGVVARKLSPRTKILAVNADGACAMAQSRKEGKPVLRVEPKSSLVDAVEGGVSESSFRLGQKYIDDVLVVKESTLKPAIAELLRRHRMVVEGSAALALAAVTEGLLPKGLKRVCLLLSGANIDAARVKDIVNHHLQACGAGPTPRAALVPAPSRRWNPRAAFGILLPRVKSPPFGCTAPERSLDGETMPRVAARRRSVPSRPAPVLSGADVAGPRHA
jgi:threonine dehydratase